MSLLPALLLAIAFAADAQPIEPRFNPDAAPTAYVGGQWWTGEAFEARDTTWAENGVFVARPPAAVARVVDLGAQYVVPPYGDAHTHMLSDPWQGPGHGELFEREGVFYALVVTNRHSWAAAVMERFAGPASVDVAYSHGGWTSPRSHPVQVYEWQALRLVGRALTDADREAIQESRLAEDDGYFEVASLEDVAAKWPTFLAHAPDLVKVFVLDSAGDLGPSLSGMTGLPQGRGLSEEVLREVVRRAHAAGLRVVAHVETGADVRLVVRAGVDGLVHLPGYDYSAGTEAPYLFGDTIPEMSARGMVVVPTSVVGDGYHVGRPARALLARDFHRRQVRALHAAGARVALGADRWSQTSKAEADYFAEHGFFPLPALLDLWTRTTPQVVFPSRAIGRLAAGFEASLLALACDPTTDWSCTGQITHREKQGAPLDRPTDADAASR